MVPIQADFQWLKNLSIKVVMSIKGTKIEGTGTVLLFHTFKSGKPSKVLRHCHSPSDISKPTIKARVQNVHLVKFADSILIDSL